jgi:hypothetical protein
MKPLCPLVEKRQRLEVSIVEAYREGGKATAHRQPWQG